MLFSQYSLTCLWIPSSSLSEQQTVESKFVNRKYEKNFESHLTEPKYMPSGLIAIQVHNKYAVFKTDGNW